MTHIERMIYWFRMNNREATLGKILRSGEPWAYEFRARMTEARRKGHNFVCAKGRTASDNLYRLVEADGSGQYQMFDISGMAAH